MSGAAAPAPAPEDDPKDLSLRGLIHDLNNVFQTILDASDLLAADAKWKKLAGAIQRSTEHGQRLVRGISEVSNSACDLEVIADIAIQLVRDFLQYAKGMEIQFSRVIEPGLWLRGNPVEWERVLVNLMLNSAQAMAKSGGKVELSAALEGSSIFIRVADNGPGIAPQILPRIFDANFSTKRASRGLGLQIVRSTVQANGGTVMARNLETGGAEFVIEVSLREPLS